MSPISNKGHEPVLRTGSCPGLHAAFSHRTLQKFGVGGTPSFFINGKVAKAGDLASFKALIDAELKTANASGLSGADYYQKAILDKGKKEAVMISPFDE